MKSNVTVEELNAATMLLTGIPVTNLVEVHVAGSIVTAITKGDNGEFVTYRILIGNPPTSPVESVEEDTTDEVSPEETDEDDGT